MDITTRAIMRLMMPRLSLVAVIFAALCATPVLAQDADLLHSDTPLWAPDAAEVWPQQFADGDGFGCVHRLKLGDWRYRTTDDIEQWYRLSNYGVFHCWMNVSQGYAPEDLGDRRPTFLISLGQADGRELWALQMGARPGSDYILLARATGPTPIDRFEVLQRRCPKTLVRGGPTLDILITRYCSVNSKQEMLALASRMAKLPPLGVMAFERETPEAP